MNGTVALKIARNELGAKCNLSEADIFSRSTECRRRMLCPVRACAPNGSVLVMESIRTLGENEFQHLFWHTDCFPDWDCLGGDDDPCPFEFKADEWGWFDGRLVAVDYSDPRLHFPPELLASLKQ